MAQTDNAAFYYRNFVLEGTVTASSEATSHDVEFVQTIYPDEFWLATGKTAETLTIDFGKAVPIRGIACIHNLNVSGTIEFEAAVDSGFTTKVIDTGELEAWSPVAGFGSDEFGTSLGGYPVLDSYNDWRALFKRDFGANTYARYARFILRNPTNSDISGVGLGMAFVGRVKQFEHNIGVDWEDVPRDPSEIIETEGNPRVKTAERYRELAVTLPRLTETEAMTVWNDMRRTLGMSKPFILVPFPAGSGPKQYRMPIYGLDMAQAGTRNPYFNRHASALRIRELRA